MEKTINIGSGIIVGEGKFSLKIKEPLYGIGGVCICQVPHNFRVSINVQHISFFYYTYDFELRVIIPILKEFSNLHEILTKIPDQNLINVGSEIRAIGSGKSPKINKRRAYAYFRL